MTGLLNRLAEANVAAVAGELTALYETAGRGAVSAAVAAELLQARPPRFVSSPDRSNSPTLHWQWLIGSGGQPGGADYLFVNLT